MAKSVPSKLRYADFLSFRPEHLLLKNSGMIRPSGDVGREYEPGGPILEPGEQELGESRVDGNFVLRRFGFYFADAPAHDALLNQNDACGEVDMLPAQRQDFGHPQAGAHGDDRHRPVRFLQNRYQLLKFLRRYNVGPLEPATRPFELYQLYRVALQVEKAPEHGALEQRVKKSADMPFGFGGQGQFLQPFAHL